MWCYCIPKCVHQISSSKMLSRNIVLDIWIQGDQYFKGAPKSTSSKNYDAFFYRLLLILYVIVIKLFLFVYDLIMPLFILYYWCIYNKVIKNSCCILTCILGHCIQTNYGASSMLTFWRRRHNVMESPSVCSPVCHTFC